MQILHKRKLMMYKLKKRKLNFKIAQNCLKYVYNLFGVDYEIKSFHQ